MQSQEAIARGIFGSPTYDIQRRNLGQTGSTFDRALASRLSLGSTAMAG
jgi:hypothetical protein